MEVIKKTSKITTKQLVFLINGSTVGVAWLTMPRVLSAEAHQHAWIAILIAAMYPLLACFLIERALRLYPGYSLVKVSKYLFGEIIGSGLLMLLVIYYILYAGVIIAHVARLARIYSLPQTPPIVVIAVLSLCAVLVTIKGIHVTAWYDEISFYSSIILMLVYCLPIPIGDYTNLLPLGQIDLQGLGRAIIPAIWAQAGIEILLVFYNLLEYPQRVLKAGLISIGLNTLMYVWVIVICLVVLGVDVTRDSMWPGLTILKVSQVSVFERLEIFYLLIMFYVISRTFITSQAAGVYALSSLFRNNQSFKPKLAWLIGMGALITALIPGTIIDVFKYTTYVSYMAMVIGLIYPLLFLGMSSLRSKKGRAG